jgi:hypothetical protein
MAPLRSLVFLQEQARAPEVTKNAIEKKINGAPGKRHIDGAQRLH